MNNHSVKVIFHSRKKFYNGKNIYWYEFVTEQKDFDFNQLPKKFLMVPFTPYYEFGGTYGEALLELTSVGFTDIIEGDEL